MSGPAQETSRLQELLLELQVHQEELEAQNEELRLAQQQLEQARESYATLYDMAPVGYFTMDKGTVIRQVNLTGCALLQKDRDALVGYPLARFVDRGDRPAFRQHVARTLKGGSRSVAEVSILAAGAVRRVQVSSHVAPDQPGAVLTAMMDITELSQVRRTLADEVARYLAIASASKDAILIVDPRGRVESHNQAAAGMFGPDLHGHRVDDLVVREAGVSDVGLRADRSTFPAEVSGGLLPNRKASVVIVRDVTQRRRLEQQVLEVSEVQRRQMGRDLHDGVSQQLAGITMLAQTLERKLTDGDLPTWQEAARVVHLLQFALAQTRELARGQYPASLERHGFQEALLELAKSQEDLHGVPCVVQASPIAVSRPLVAINLYRLAQESITNAMKHACPRRVDVRWRAHGSSAVLEVSDDGIGFDPSISGDGMGLGIMRHRAAVLHAVFTLITRPGAGTTVRCTLSRAQLEADSDPLSPATSRPTS